MQELTSKAQVKKNTQEHLHETGNRPANFFARTLLMQGVFKEKSGIIFGREPSLEIFISISQWNGMGFTTQETQSSLTLNVQA